MASTTIPRDDLPEEINLDELLALALEQAYQERKNDHPSTREHSLVITNLEQAALWRCHDRTKRMLGDNGLLDSLRQI